MHLKEKNIKINIVKFRLIHYIYLLTIIPFVPYAGLENELTNNIYLFCKIFIIIIVFIVCFRYHSTDFFIIILSVFSLLMLFSSIINSNFNIPILINILPPITLSLVFSIAYKRKEVSIYLESYMFYFTVSIWLNFILMLTSPDGLSYDIRYGQVSTYKEFIPIHLLGKSNALAPVFISGLYFIFLYSYRKYGKIKLLHKITFCITALSCILSGSSTAIMSILIFILMITYYWFANRLKHLPPFKFKMLFICLIIVMFSVILFNFQEIFNNIFLYLFNKDASLSNRTNVWQTAIQFIKQNFTNSELLIGMGDFSYQIVFFNSRYAHAHNQFLDIFIKGGMLSLILYILMFYITINRLDTQYKITKSRYLTILAILCLIYPVIFISEVYNSPLIIVVIYITYKISKNQFIERRGV